MDRLDAKNGYCSAQLKLAENQARDGYDASAIAAVGIGLERLLKELFDELRDTDKSNLIELSMAYEKATRRRRRSIWKQGKKELSFFGWIKFYQKENIFGKLEETCGYKFDEFNIDSLHQIRTARNEYGSHPNDEYGVHRELSSRLIELYSKILTETDRNAHQTSIVPSNKMQSADTQELMLLPNEKSVLKRHYDEIIRIEPNNIDVLFLRAYLLRGQKTAHEDIEKVLTLNPNHTEAQKERIWNLNRRLPEEPDSHQSSIHLTQVNISLQQLVIQRFSKTRNFIVNILSENTFTFKPKISFFNLSISEKATRDFRNLGIVLSTIFGIVAVVVIVTVAISVLALLVFFKDSPHLPGLIIVVLFLLWSLIRHLYP